MKKLKAFFTTQRSAQDGAPATAVAATAPVRARRPATTGGEAGPPGDGWGMAFLRSAEQRTQGDGWGMTFLRKAEQREALLALATDPSHSPAELAGLLAQYPDLEVRDGQGRTALMSAAAAGNIQAVMALVVHGADVLATDAEGNSALHAVSGEPDTRAAQAVLQAMLAAGATLQTENHRGMTPLFQAATAAVVNFQVNLGADIHHRDKSGRTPLLCAAESGNSQVMLALLERGADPRDRDEQGDSFSDLLGRHYGLAAGATISSEPKAAAAFIRMLEADIENARAPASKIALEAPVPASGAAARPINSLRSGAKISLVDKPEQSLAQLSEAAVGALSEALGFGALADDAGQAARQRVAVTQVFHGLQSDLSNGFAQYDGQVLGQAELTSSLTQAQREELEEVIRIAHVSIAAQRDIRGNFTKPYTLQLMCWGTQSAADVKQDIGSGLGKIGDVDRAAKRVGELLAQQMDQVGNLRIDRVCGISMGGATAQTLLATVQSRVAVQEQPSMLLLDPQLLNNRQAARAVRGGSFAVDYAKPRGVALSLDYEKAPHRGLMGIMKGPGRYKYPGLVHLKLGLQDTDGAGGQRPKTSGPPGMGYHVDLGLYRRALGRFAPQS